MYDNVSLILLAGAVGLLTLLYAQSAPQSAERWYRRAVFLRRVLGVAFTALAIYWFLRSDNPALMGLALLAVAFLVLYVYFERPGREMV